MDAWELFEIECTKYLSEHFGDIATFNRKGGSNSTISDIEVIKNNGERFYIEAKHCPAQCGQFVLLPDISTHKFIYSPKNINKFNQYAEIIMLEMDKDFDSFRDAGTSGKDIVFDNNQEIFSKWIIDIYKSKKVKYIITNDFKIVPLEDFSKAFNIIGKYRIKRSGSSSVGKNNINIVQNYIATNYSITNYYYENDKLFIESEKELHNLRFIIGGNEYMFSQRGDNYEIRRLSNTYNANVIFSIYYNQSYKSDNSI